MNYYQRFNLPITFTLDEAALKQEYFALQRQYHPDKIGLAGVQQSMELNQAYQTLSHPLKRAQHFLMLHGVNVGHDDSPIKPAMALLEEMMDKREAVMELETAEAANALLAVAAEEYAQELANFTGMSAAPSIDEAKDKLAQSLLRLQYIAKWQGEIKQQAKRLEAL